MTTAFLLLAQIIAIAWDAQPLAESYVVTVDQTQIASTTALTVPWTPTAAYHRVCVASRAMNVTGQPGCVDYGVPPAPNPQPPPAIEMSLTAQPATITAGQSSTLSYTWNAQTRHVVKLDGSPLPCTPVNNQCAGTVSVMPIQTTTYVMTAADGSPAPSVQTTVTVNPLPPIPPPTTQVGPVVTIRSCSEWVEAEKPISATGTGWVVQYFDQGEAITTPSATRKRAVTLAPGPHRISAVWSKAGQQPLPSGSTVVTCQ